MPVKMEEIYDRFDAGLRAFVRSRVGDPDAADDVLQDVYLMVRLTAQTVPFRPQPVVHCEVMLRRWAVLTPDARKGLYLPSDRDTSVYLRTSVPWLVEGDYTSCFQVAPIAWRGGAKWGGRLAPLLERLTMRKRLPEPEEICKNPSSYLNFGGADNAAIVYRNGLRPKHGAEAGLMPVDREDVWGQVVCALEGVARPVDLLPRVTYGVRVPKQAAGVVTPKDAASAEATDIAGRQRVLRTAVAEATGGALRLDLLYQNDPMRDSVVDQVRSSLGLGEPRTNGPGLAWDTEELIVTIDPRPPGAAASPLDLATGRGDDRRRRAMRRRGDEVARLFAPDGPVSAGIVELGDATHFESEPAADPKHAIRLGAAKAGRTTQFLGLYQPDDGQRGPNIAHRVE